MDKLILGTAMWGWTIDRKQCHQILDVFYEAGGREVDTATNYPINKNPADFRLAENILLEWINANGIDDLKVMMKIGSLHNLGTPENNLAPSFILMTGREYQSKFKSNLSTLMLHWDNREDKEVISASIDALSVLQEEGVEIGFSGVKNPDLYAKILENSSFKCGRIQIKHNVLYSDYERYQPLHQRADFIAYGINAGGLKLDPNTYLDNASLLARGGKFEQHHELITRLNKLMAQENEKNKGSILSRMNHIGLIYALYHPSIKQVLVGTSTVDQLKDTIKSVEAILAVDYSRFYRTLHKELS